MKEVFIISTVLRMTAIRINGVMINQKNANRNDSNRNLQMGIEMIQCNSLEIKIANGIKKGTS